jgi:hypothetical protein
MEVQLQVPAVPHRLHALCSFNLLLFIFVNSFKCHSNKSFSKTSFIHACLLACLHAYHALLTPGKNKCVRQYCILRH